MTYDPLLDPLVEVLPPRRGQGDLTRNIYPMLQEAYDRRFVGPAKKVGVWVMVSGSLLRDDAASSLGVIGYVHLALSDKLRRFLSPWLFPDPPAIAWTFEPFPRWARLASSVRRWNDRAASAVASRLDRWADSWRS